MAPLGLRKTISNSLNINETDIAQTKACEPKIWVERVRQKSGADHERDFRFSFERHQPFTSDARVEKESRTVCGMGRISAASLTEVLCSQGIDVTQTTVPRCAQVRRMSGTRALIGHLGGK